MISWYLLSIEDIALLRQSNNNLYRRQKSYYKKTGNAVMLARLEEAENSDFEIHKIVFKPA